MRCRVCFVWGQVVRVLICQVKVLSWEGSCCGGAVVLEMCVLWLEVASHVWSNVCSEWLQVVSGGLCGGSMCVCGSVSEGLYSIKLYIARCAGWSTGKPGSRLCAICRGCYSTSFVIRGVGKGKWLVGLVVSARPGFVQK